jgi:hypothetical protein
MMIIKSWIKPENRVKYFTWLGYAAQIALVLGISLERLENPTLDFITGFLIGFSIIGNLAFIYTISRTDNFGGRK